MAWDRSRQRLHAGAILLAACAFAASAPVWAQDVAEAARQEQARKDRQANGLKHVYTEEDLKHAKILTREDRELLDAKKREQPAPGTIAVPDIDAQALDQLPLGDVARMYRAMKELNPQTGQSAEYHLPFSSAPSLASPKAVSEFVDSRPNAIQTTGHAAPVAPVFSNSQPGASYTSTSIRNAQPHISFEMPRPRAVHAAALRTPEASIFPNTVAPITTAAARVFVVPTPRDAQPSMRHEPVAPLFPNAEAPKTIIVKRGDSFWKLAEVNLGDGRRWHELAVVNPAIVNPHHIVPGTAINLGGTAPSKPTAPSAPNDSNITVVKGDSLWKIAKAQLGAGGFWGCIAKANPRIIDANRIYAGEVLNLPGSCENSSSK